MLALSASSRRKASLPQIHRPDHSPRPIAASTVPAMPRPAALLPRISSALLRCARQRPPLHRARPARWSSWSPRRLTNALLGGDASASRALGLPAPHCRHPGRMRLEASTREARALAASRVDVRVAAAATQEPARSAVAALARPAPYVTAAASCCESRARRTQRRRGTRRACAVALRQTVPEAKLHGYDTIASALRALAASKVDAYSGRRVTSRAPWATAWPPRGRTRIGARQFASEVPPSASRCAATTPPCCNRLDGGLQGIDRVTRASRLARWLRRDLLPGPAATAASPETIRRAGTLPPHDAEAIPPRQ